MLKISNKEAATAKALEFQKEFEAEAAGIILPKKIREGAEASLGDLIEDYVSDLKKRVKSSSGKTQNNPRVVYLN